MDTVAIHLAIAPLTDVALTMDTLPSAEAMLHLLLPFAIVNFAVRPSVNALTVRLIVEEEANVPAPTAEDLITSAVSPIVLPLALINMAIGINQDTKTMPFTLSQDTLIERVLGPFDAKLLRIFDLIEIE